MRQYIRHSAGLKGNPGHPLYRFHGYPSRNVRYTFVVESREKTQRTPHGLAPPCSRFRFSWPRQAARAFPSRPSFPPVWLSWFRWWRCRVRRPPGCPPCASAEPRFTRTTTAEAGSNSAPLAANSRVKLPGQLGVDFPEHLERSLSFLDLAHPDMGRTELEPGPTEFRCQA